MIKHDENTINQSSTSWPCSHEFSTTRERGSGDSSRIPHHLKYKINKTKRAGEEERRKAFRYSLPFSRIKFRNDTEVCRSFVSKFQTTLIIFSYFK